MNDKREELLDDLKEKGLIIFMNQKGINNESVMCRPVISGYLSRSYTEKLQEQMQIHTNYICFIVVPSQVNSTYITGYDKKNKKVNSYCMYSSIYEFNRLEKEKQVNTKNEGTDVVSIIDPNFGSSLQTLLKTVSEILTNIF